MENTNMTDIVRVQREFFDAGKTRAVGTRRSYLEALREALIRYEKEMMNAVRADMGRPEVETFFMETNMNLDELDLALKQLKTWTSPKKVKTPMLFFGARSEIYPEPYGVTLVISAWNFPILQTLSPLIGAIAAGNTCILKPAGDAPECGKILHRIISEVFPAEYATVVLGPSDKTTALLEEKLDFVFFTGSPKVGRIIHAACSKNLVPCILELGGKSPAIVDASADVDLAAKRIIWAKLFNAGQICVTADHAYVHESIVDTFIEACKKYIVAFYGKDPSRSPDYGAIINDRNFDRLMPLLESGTRVYGGGHDKQRRYIEPTILRDVSESSPIMQEEIFGPILPVLSFRSHEDFIHLSRRKEKPLALYIFSKDSKVTEAIIAGTSAGGVSVNDCMVHGGTAALPFGGVGNSGMGSYHGYKTFEVFSHMKSVMKAPSSRILDLSLKYPPYRGKLAILKRLKKFGLI